MQFEEIKFLDIHYHANPDLYQRRYNVLEAGQHYQQLGGGVVLVSHLGSTAVQATIAQQCGLPVFAAVTLNSINGGIDYRSVLRALAEYQPILPTRLIVHLPTITSHACQSKLRRKIVHHRLRNGTTCAESIVDTVSGKLRKELIDLCKLSRDYPIVLSTGHSSKQELFALLELCEKFSVPSILLNQPANPIVGMKASELQEIAKNYFVWIEQTSLTFLLGYQDVDDCCEVLRKVPRVIYSSDLGQTDQIDIAQWRHVTAKWFSQFNISSKRKQELCLHNPLNLLKI